MISRGINGQLNEIHVKKSQQAQGAPVSLSGVFYHQEFLIIDYICFRNSTLIFNKNNEDISKLEKPIQLAPDLSACRWEVPAST